MPISPARGHQEVRRSTGQTNADREIFIFPIQLTTSRIGNHTRLIHALAVCMCDYTSWGQPATQTNRDPNRGKTLARFNQPITSETYRRQDDVFGNEVQFLLSVVLQVFQYLNYKLQRKLSGGVLPTQQCHKNCLKKVFSSWGITQRQVTRHGTNQCHQYGPSNLFTPYREQPRSIRIVVTYPRPAFSPTKRTNHAPISFAQQAQVSQGHTSCGNTEKN